MKKAQAGIVLLVRFGGGISVELLPPSWFFPGVFAGGAIATVLGLPILWFWPAFLIDAHPATLWTSRAWEWENVHKFFRPSPELAAICDELLLFYR